ncbi:HNH endonuclease [Luteolibacter sp. Populi]|uniref:HNH endonuclease n=1 Tax=Luteolibacter sp. Populi TaxID=3230487 RepID=UPI003465C56E
MDKRTIRERAEGRCEYCRAPEAVSEYAFMVDHVVPRSRDGSDELENLALSCWCCNLFESYHVRGLDPRDGKRVALFHPRREKRMEHFVWTKIFTRIEGVTARGRATVARLQMNSNPDRSEARRLWHAAGYLP